MKIYYKAFAVFACWFLCSPIQTNKLFSFVRYTFISISYNRSCEQLLPLDQKSQNCTNSFYNCFSSQKRDIKILSLVFLVFGFNRSSRNRSVQVCL